MKLLIVEDEIELLHEMKSYLTTDYEVIEYAQNFNSASEKLSLYEYDLAIIDITLPDGNGLELVKMLKTAQKNTGILIVSAKNALDDKIQGLEWGADDYITKPFHLAELNARIKSVARRRMFEGKKTIEYKTINIDPDNKLVRVIDQTLSLTRKEYELLLFFVTNKSRLLTKSAIAEHLWGDDIDLADNYDFIYTHINNLRKKITSAGGEDYLSTIYGMGYKFE